MAINFPNSPVNNETYTENGVKWKYNSTYNAWFLVDDNKLLANTSNNQLVYIYNDKLVSSNGLVYSESSNTIYTNSVYVKSINVESGIAAAYDKANSANILAFNTGIGANAFAAATIAGANTAVGAGANAYAASIANTIAIAAYDKANTGGGGYFAGNRDEVGASNYGDIFRVHSNTLTQNVTIYSGNNALCAGPITISGAGTTLTIQTGARVVIA